MHLTQDSTYSLASRKAITKLLVVQQWQIEHAYILRGWQVSRPQTNRRLRRRRRRPTSDGIGGYRSGCRGEAWRNRTLSRVSMSASWLGHADRKTFGWILSAHDAQLSRPRSPFSEPSILSSGIGRVSQLTATASVRRAGEQLELFSSLVDSSRQSPPCVERFVTEREITLLLVTSDRCPDADRNRLE
jgi:hypothetical protein